MLRQDDRFLSLRQIDGPEQWLSAPTSGDLSASVDLRISTTPTLAAKLAEYLAWILSTSTVAMVASQSPSQMSWRFGIRRAGAHDKFRSLTEVSAATIPLGHKTAPTLSETPSFRTRTGTLHQHAASESGKSIRETASQFLNVPWAQAQALK